VLLIQPEQCIVHSRTARLQAAAVPGTILVSAAVADYLQEGEITKGSPLELKGVDETVLTFAVTPEIMVNR
jgi:class 3 adenylate cyclase